MAEHKRDGGAGERRMAWGDASPKEESRGDCSPKEESGDRKRRRVAIYGGAFDPPTNAHTTCAAEIVHSGCADEVWLVPCGPRPDKPKLKTSPLDRYCMTQIAVNTAFSSNFPVKVSDIECFSDCAYYSYDLLAALSEKYPKHDFCFVVGSDWLTPESDIRTWRSKNRKWKEGDPEEDKTVVTGERLLNEFDFIIVPRPGFNVARTEEDPTGLLKFGPRLSWLRMPEKMTLIEGNLSSTEVRRRSSAEPERLSLRNIEGLVPVSVMGFIRRAGLYQ